MEQRVEQLETIAQLQIRWARLMEQQAGRVDVQARRTEEQARWTEEQARRTEEQARWTEEQARRTEEQARRTEEQSGLMEQNAKERGEIMNQLLARVGLLEADVARIDATHS